MGQDSANTTQEKSLDSMAGMRNEPIVETANVSTLARSVTLVSLGLAALGVDQVTGFFKRSTKRGEKLEADTRKAIKWYRDNVNAQMDLAKASRTALLKQTNVTLGENLKIVTQIVLPTRVHSGPEVRQSGAAETDDGQRAADA